VGNKIKLGMGFKPVGNKIKLGMGFPTGGRRLVNGDYFLAIFCCHRWGIK